MTLAEFNARPAEQQLTLVFVEGTFLARRWEEENSINLYHLPGGVFAETCYDVQTKAIVLLRSFTSPDLLDAYTVDIELPKDL
jgi:hypothetical protein